MTTHRAAKRKRAGKRTAKERVLARWPDARSVWYRIHWQIWLCYSNGGVKIIGAAKTARAAWAAAARNLKGK